MSSVKGWGHTQLAENSLNVCCRYLPCYSISFCMLIPGKQNEHEESRFMHHSNAVSSDTAGASELRVPVNFSLCLPTYRVGFVQVATKAKQDCSKKNQLDAVWEWTIYKWEEKYEREKGGQILWTILMALCHHSSIRKPSYRRGIPLTAWSYCRDSRYSVSLPQLRMEDKTGREWACCWELLLSALQIAPWGPSLSREEMERMTQAGIAPEDLESGIR